MAASSEERETTEVRNDDLTGIIRQCVREEINLQRNGRQGTSNLLNRTRDLIANATTSVPREFSISHNVSLGSSSTLPSPSTRPRNSDPSNPQWPRRSSTSSHALHPWRFKKKKEESKKLKPDKIVTKQVCLIDEPPDHSDNELVPDYTLGEDMILVKGYCNFSTSSTETDIRKEISEMLQQRFPLITTAFFDFVKRERNTIITPVVKLSHKWDFQQVKELCGQGKMYVRLNVDREALEVSEDPVQNEYKSEHSSSGPTTPRPSSPKESRNSTLIASASSSSERNSSDLPDIVEIVREQPSPNDSLQEMLPTSSAETIANTLMRCGGDINSTLDSLLDEEGDQDGLTLSQLLEKLKARMKDRRAKLTVDHDDIFNDAMAFYKDATFDPEAPLRITFVDQPAIDGGGLLRQFFTDLYSCFIEGKPVCLFFGESGRMCPTHSPQIVFSSLFEIVGKVIAHSLAQGGPGFPFLSLPCYYYLATGDVISAMAYCDPYDIPDALNRQWVLKLVDAKNDEDMEELMANSQFMDLYSSCGDTSLVNISNKEKIILSMVSFEVIGKRKMALDQLRKGMKTLGLLAEMEKHPRLFERIFHQGRKELTPSDLKDLLLFPPEEEQSKEMLRRFIDKSPQQTLQNFLKFCTGNRDMLPLHDKKIEIEFHDHGFIFSSTCSLRLQLPKSFSTYNMFEEALLSVIQDFGKSFTTA